MAKQQRTMRVDQRGQIAAMQQLEGRSDEELEAETKYKAFAQAILGQRAAERQDAKAARAHFQRALAAARPQERMQFRRMADGPEPEPESELTPRETEILKMVATGMSYRQIADRLVLSHRTVQNHVQSTLRKLQMHNRVELTRYVLERGLGDDE